MQAEFLNGTKNRTSGHVQFETCEVYHGVLVLLLGVLFNKKIEDMKQLL